MTTRLVLGLAAALCLVPSAAASDATLHPDLPRLLAEHEGRATVWIALADKPVDDLAVALAHAQSLLPPRTLARRAARRSTPGLVDVSDLAVHPAYVQAIAATGAELRVQSRWLNAVSASVDAQQLAAIAALPFVTAVRPVARSAGIDATSSRVDTPPAAATWAGTIDYGYALEQTELIDLHKLHDLGYTGAGVVIGILDTGFATTHDAFNQPGHVVDVIASYDFVDGDPVVAPEFGDDPDQHYHGTAILGMLAAWLPGSLVGAAPDASYILCKTEDYTAEYQGEEDFYVAGLEFAELNGADVVTSSLGYIDWYSQTDLDGLTAPVTIAVNAATANGVICCTAAGNAGHDTDPGTSTLIAPADAFDVITCGAVQPTGEIASFSSEGPTADGRVKPEVLAMGQSTVSVWPWDDTSYGYFDGTSLSTPTVAGVVACLVGADPSWSVASLRERLTKTADYFGAPAPDPLFVTGWGTLDADGALALAGSITDLGGAMAGVAGLPDLSAAGSLVADEPLNMDLANGKPGGSAWLVLGLTLLDAPFKGGTLKPSIDVLLPGVPLDGAGAFALVLPWVPGLPSGVSAYVQAWIPDTAGPKGFSASQGLQLTTP